MSSLPYPSVESYRIPRESVDVEAIAQKFVWYLQAAGEDTEYLSYDPTRRDKLIAEFNERPDVAPNFGAENLVPFGSDPDVYLKFADGEIERLTPPQSFEDRIMRLHFVFAALMVFNHYKFKYGLLDNHDLRLKVVERQTQLMKEWYDTVFCRLFPDRVKPKSAPSNALTTSRSRPVPINPPATGGRTVSARFVDADDVKQFLNNPHTLVGKRFVHMPPVDQDQDYRGTWQVDSYTVRRVDMDVEHEYLVLLEAFGDSPVPMGPEEVGYLLRYSQVQATL